MHLFSLIDGTDSHTYGSVRFAARDRDDIILCGSAEWPGGKHVSEALFAKLQEVHRTISVGDFGICVPNALHVGVGWMGKSLVRALADCGGPRPNAPLKTYECDDGWFWVEPAILLKARLAHWCRYAIAQAESTRGTTLADIIWRANLAPDIVHAASRTVQLPAAH